MILIFWIYADNKNKKQGYPYSVGLLLPAEAVIAMTL